MTIKQGCLNEYYKIRIWGYIGKIKVKTKTVLKNRHGHNKTTQDKPQTQGWRTETKTPAVKTIHHW